MQPNLFDSMWYVLASYFAVAVIKADDTTTTLTATGLRGKKTCHTGYKKTSGWNVPIGYLAQTGKKNVNLDLTSMFYKSKVKT